MNHLSTLAIQNITDTLFEALEHTSQHRAIIFYDTDYPLTALLTSAYRTILPTATFIDVSTVSKEHILADIDTLTPRDLVVLIQSSDFRLNDFRIRIYLFQKKLKVIEHRHLSRHPRDTWETYIRALAYDKVWYRETGHRLKALIEHSDALVFTSAETRLVIDGGFEIPKLNVGDYTDMKNIGGTFPIGEIFTEAKNLYTANGSLMVYAFADTNYLLQTFPPFRVDIRDGLIVGWSTDTPHAFVSVIETVRAYERPLIREIGFGLNRAITRNTPLHDITAFERTLGIHFSIGEKHTVYKKQGIHADKTRFHVDVFPLTTTVYADDTVLFTNNTYVVPTD